MTEHSRKVRRLVEWCFAAMHVDALRKAMEWCFAAMHMDALRKAMECKWREAMECSRQYHKPLLCLALLAFVVVLKRWAYVDMEIAGAQSCREYGWDDFVGRRVVWDAVPINSELDILKVRLHELDSVVDHFVIVEAPFTFSGKPKRLFFDEVKESDPLFAKFLPKARAQTVEGPRR